MGRKRVLGSGLTAIATVAVMAACASSGSQPGTQAASTPAASTPPAPTQAAPTQAAPTQAAPTQAAATPASTTSATTPKEFVSKRYDFAVTLPQDWSQSDAQFDWDGKTLGSPGAPFFETFSSPISRRNLVAAAAPVPKGTRLVDWQEAIVRGEGNCSDSSSAEKTTLDGEPALAWTWKCDGGYVEVNLLAALHGKRGYVIYLPSATENDEAEDRRIFEGIRKSFHFSN